MKISASVEYGARILVQLARSPAGAPMTADKIAAIEHIPRAYVDQILLRLRRAGIAESQRGVQGGHLLAKPASEITMGMMMRAIEGAIFEDVCQKYSAGDQLCGRSSACDIKPAWTRLIQLVEDYLDHLTLEQVLAESRPCGALPIFPAADPVVRNIERSSQ